MAKKKTETVIVNYKADTSEVKKAIKEIEHLEATIKRVNALFKKTVIVKIDVVNK